MCCTASWAIVLLYVLRLEAANLEKYGSAGLSTEEIIKGPNYPCEVHKIETADGYILTPFRIPHGKGQDTRGSRPPFWLQLGLIGSSDQYVALGPGRALPFLLADKGYDVWIGNVRGNRYSQGHKRYSPSNPKFWNFSWDEMGIYDLPAVVDYVLNVTKQEKMYYAGHSMGTAMLMVFFNTHPEYQEKIALAFGLAPAVFVGRSRSVVFNYMCTVLSPFLLKNLGTYAAPPNNFATVQNWFWPKCSPELKTSVLCESIYVLTGGPTTELNRDTLPLFLSRTPSQASLKTFTHYGQNVKTGEFRAFDYGEKRNIKKYGTPKPPAYQLKNITAPIVLMFSDNDYIVIPEDEYDLCLSLGNVVEYYRVPLHTFSHLDFLYGRTAKEFVYDKMFEILDKGSSILSQKAICINYTDGVGCSRISDFWDW